MGYAYEKLGKRISQYNDSIISGNIIMGLILNLYIQFLLDGSYWYLYYADKF